jgi:hypothetical protein
VHEHPPHVRGLEHHDGIVIHELGADRTAGDRGITRRV